LCGVGFDAGSGLSCDRHRGSVFRNVGIRGRQSLACLLSRQSSRGSATDRHRAPGICARDRQPARGMAGCLRCAFVGLVFGTPEWDSESMTWKPERRQIDLIAEYCAANMPVAATAAALHVHPDDLRARIGKLAATRLCGLPEPSTLAAPPAPGHRPGRVLAERAFQAQPDAHIDDLAEN
jgi:hypothetical protein